MKNLNAKFQKHDQGALNLSGIIQINFEGTNYWDTATYTFIMREKKQHN